MYYNPRKRAPLVISIEERVANFRNYRRDVNRTLGEFLSVYLDLWRKAKGGGITDFEASHRLLAQLPPKWKEWAQTQMIDILQVDELTYMPIADFPRLVCRVFIQWSISEKPPAIREGNLIPGPIVPPNAPVEPRDFLQEEVSSCISPLRRKGQYNDEAGPSRIRTSMPQPEIFSAEVQMQEMHPIQENSHLAPLFSPTMDMSVREGCRRTRGIPKRSFRRTARMSVRPQAPLPLSFLQHADRLWNEQGR